MSRTPELVASKVSLSISHISPHGWSYDMEIHPFSVLQIGRALKGCSIKNVALLVPSHVTMSTVLRSSALSSVYLGASVQMVLLRRTEGVNFHTSALGTNVSDCQLIMQVIIIVARFVFTQCGSS